MELVETLWSIEQIKLLKARYCRSTDARDTDQFLGTMTADVQWTALNVDGSLNRRFDGSAAFGDYLASVHEARMAGFSRHECFLPEIQILDATRAKGIWAFSDVVHDIGRQHFTGSGYYDEEYVRDASGEWRISRCTVRRVRLEHLPMPEEPSA